MINLFEFSTLTQEKLGYYIYALTHPLSKKPFYIGKGKGNRIFDHINDAINNKSGKTSEKFNYIRKYNQKYGNVGKFIIRHGINSEKQAFDIEAALIDTLETLMGYDLTNIVKGHGSSINGVCKVEEINALYQATKFENHNHPILIININKKYDKMDNDEKSIYNAVRKSWVLSSSRVKSVNYVLAEYKGIIREVFKVESWYKTRDEKNKERLGFNGKVADEDIRFLYIYKKLDNFKKKGQANPIQYLNC